MNAIFFSSLSVLFLFSYSLRLRGGCRNLGFHEPRNCESDHTRKLCPMPIVDPLVYLQKTSHSRVSRGTFQWRWPPNQHTPAALTTLSKFCGKPCNLNESVTGPGRGISGFLIPQSPTLTERVFVLCIDFLSGSDLTKSVLCVLPRSPRNWSPSMTQLISRQWKYPIRPVKKLPFTYWRSSTRRYLTLTPGSLTLTWVDNDITVSGEGVEAFYVDVLEEGCKKRKRLTVLWLFPSSAALLWERRWQSSIHSNLKQFVPQKVCWGCLIEISGMFVPHMQFKVTAFPIFMYVHWGNRGFHGHNLNNCMLFFLYLKCSQYVSPLHVHWSTVPCLSW